MLWDPFLMKKLLKSVILWDSWTMHVYSWLVNNCRPNKKKKKRERKTQNTKHKYQINLNPNGYWVLASAPVKPHPLPTPHSSWENIIIKQERKERYKKIKKGTPLFISGQKYKAYGKIGEQDILYYAFRKKRKL